VSGFAELSGSLSLKGPSVSLVPLSIDHLADFARYCGEQSLWTWWLRKPPVDVEGMRSEIALALQQQSSGLRVPLAIFHRERQEHIGSTSLWHLDQRCRTMEIGSTWLALPFHGTGINRECKNLLLTYAFETLHLDSVTLQTDVLNARSRRAIEKLGGKLQRIIAGDKVVWDGRVRSSAVYRILRDESLQQSKTAASVE